MADHQTHRAAREARIGHQADDDVALAAQRGDARGRVEHFRHAGRTHRAVVTHDHHVVVLEFLRMLVERRDQATLAFEHARGAAEAIVLEAAFDTGELEDRGEFRRQVAAEYAQAAGRLVRLRDVVDDLAVGRFGLQALDLLGQRFAGAGQHVAIDQAGFHQLAHDHLHAADIVDVHHRIFAVGARVGEDRHDILREIVEFLRRHDFLPEVAEACGARDFRRMQCHIGRAADRQRDDDSVADRVTADDVARLDALRDHVREIADQLFRELFQAARIVGRRRHHVQRLHAHHADEGLHGVVGEDAAAGADARAGMAGDVVAIFGIRIAGDLIGADDVQLLAGLRIFARMDRAVRHDDRGLVVFEQRSQRADRRLVAGDHGDGAEQAGGAQMLRQRVIGDLAADQRIAHFARAVADAVRGGDGVFRLHQAIGQLARAAADLLLQALMDGVHLGHHAHIALAVALGAHHAHRRLVNERLVRAEHARDPDGLRGTAGVLVDGDDGGLGHDEFLPSGGYSWEKTTGRLAPVPVRRVCE